jgi:hypothetical protein
VKCAPAHPDEGRAPSTRVQSSHAGGGGEDAVDPVHRSVSPASFQSPYRPSDDSASDFDDDRHSQEEEEARIPDFSSKASTRQFPASPWSCGVWRSARKVDNPKPPAAPSVDEEVLP